MATLMSSRTMRLAGNAPRSAVVVPARPVSCHIGVPCSTSAAVPATFAARAHALACRAAATEVEVLSVEMASAPRVVELTIESWEAFMAEAGDQPVLVDFFTDWCGPCKLISPELEKFAAEYSGMRFAKFNCGTNDKRFAIAKGIKALPTFHMYRNNEKLGEFVGAKPVALRKFVEEHIEGC